MKANECGERSKITKFILVRHVRAFNVEGRCIGHTDVPLCSEGEAAFRQTLAAQQHAQDMPSLPAAVGTVEIVTSDLVRAERTAHIIAESVSLPGGVDRRLREVSFGDWDGRTWSDIEQADGARLKAWMEQWGAVAPPGGESVAALFARAMRWLEEVAARTVQGEHTVIAVSHAGWIRSVVCCLLDIPMANMFDVAIDHAHAMVIETCGRRSVLVAGNVEFSLDLLRATRSGQDSCFGS